MGKEELFDSFDLNSLIEIPGNGESFEELEEKEKKKQISEEDIKEKEDDGLIEIDTETVQEQEDVDEKKKESEETPSEESSSSPSPYLAFANAISKEGVLTDFTEDEWNELVKTKGEDGALLELTNRTLEERLQYELEQYKGSLSETDRVIFESKLNGVPLDDAGFVYHNKQYLASLKDEDLEKIDVQKDLIRQELELSGFSDEEIEDTIQAFEDTDKLGSKSKLSFKKLTTYWKEEESNLKKKAEEERAEKEETRQRNIANLRSVIDNWSEVVPGLKMNKQTKDKVFDSIVNPVAQTKEGTLLNAVGVTRHRNPQVFEAALNYYHHLGLFNIDDKGNFKPDFSKIMEVLGTETSKKTRKIFEENTVFKGGKPVIPKDNEIKGTEVLESFKRLDAAMKNRR